MPIYSYKAIDAAGRKQRGQLEAQDERELEERLRGEGLYLLSVRLQKTPMRTVSLLDRLARGEEVFLHPSYKSFWPLNIIALVIAVVVYMTFWKTYMGYAIIFSACLGLAQIPIFLLWYSRRYFISPTKVRVEVGLFGRYSSEILIKHIRNVIIRQGAIDRFYCVSDIVFETAGSRLNEVVFQGIDHPQAIRDFIMGRME